MKRFAITGVGLYLLFAVIGRFVEAMGAVECGCSEKCWCKKPVLNTFRWVGPFGHVGCSAETKVDMRGLKCDRTATVIIR